MEANSGRDIEIFSEAIQLPTGERAAFLDRVCGENKELRQKMEALLKHNDATGGILEQPAVTIRDGRSRVAAGEKPGDKIDRYRLLQQIGEGGCGIVFMAEQEEPVRRRVALKIIKPGMDTSSVIARFEAERQALALMDHPNIAHVYDAGTTEYGRPYFVMELVEGFKITDYCDRHSLPTSTRLELFIQVCDAIQHAHQKGIIHRDIKPSNILVAMEQDRKPVPKVIDFGIAKAIAGNQLTDKTIFTTREMLIGTPAYMSPEQAALANSEVDTRTDIYSLGVLLYELLTGTTPFNAHELLKAGFDEIRRVVRDVEPARPSTRLTAMNGADFAEMCRLRHSEPTALIRQLRGDLDWIVMMALEKDRTRRYKTANGLALDVQRFLTGQTVSARPPSMLYQFQKAALRHKLLYSGIGAIALLLVTSLIIVSTVLAKERLARREAEAASVKSQQVIKLLEDALEDVGPGVASGQETVMLQGILNRAAERIGSEMTNQPAEEADLRTVIGTVYRQLASYHQAEEMHRAALGIRRQLFGLNDPRVADTLNELGYELQAENKDSEAESAFGEALAIRQRLYGRKNAATATSMNNLGAVYRDEGRLNEAEALAREALGIRQSLLVKTNLDVADSLRNLSIILGDQGKWAESEATARKVLVIRRQVLGPVHPWVADALIDVAWAAGAQNKTKEAEALQREALAMRQKLLPPEHPDVAKSLQLVGESMRKNGNLTEASSVLSAALAIQNKVLGEDDPASLQTLQDLGLTLAAQGNWPEAEAVQRKALGLRRKLDGNESRPTLYVMSDLGMALENEHKWTEAEALYHEALALSDKILGTDDPHTTYIMRRLALTFEGEGKWADAESTDEAVLAILRKRPGDQEDILEILHRLELILQTENKWPEEELALREDLTVNQKRLGSTDPATLFLMHQLGSTLNNEHKWPEAEAIHRDALALLRKKSGNDDPQTLYAMRDLAETLEDEGKLGEVEDLYRAELASWKKQAGNEDQQIFYTRRKLGLTLAAEGKWPEAEAVFRESLTLARKHGNQDLEALADLGRLVRVLMPQKKFGDADRLLSEALTPAFVSQPAAADLLNQRMNIRGRQGHWAEAAADATLVLQLQPEDHYNYHTLAALLAMTQNRPAYEQLCQRILGKFAGTKNYFIAERMAQDCLLLPRSGVDLKVVDALADVSVMLGKDDPSLPYFQGCKAMSNYRLGHFVGAIEWAGKVATNSPTPAQAKALAVLAMGNWQLGQKDTARAAFVKGDALAPHPSLQDGAMDLGDSWVAWLMARISLDEAAGMINAVPTAEINSRP